MGLMDTQSYAGCLAIKEPFWLVNICNNELPEELKKELYKINAGRKKDDDDEENEEDDYYNDEEEGENPFDREPTDREIVDNEFPVNPEEDLFDEDEDVPYN